MPTIAHNMLSNREGLVAGFYGAWPSHHHDVAPADGDVAVWEADYGVIWLHIAADQLVRLADADNFAHARHLFQRAGFECALVSGDADRSPLRSGNRVRAK